MLLLLLLFRLSLLAFSERPMAPSLHGVAAAVFLSERRAVWCHPRPLERPSDVKLPSGQVQARVARSCMSSWLQAGSPSAASGSRGCWCNLLGIMIERRRQARRQERTLFSFFALTRGSQCGR